MSEGLATDTDTDTDAGDLGDDFAGYDDPDLDDELDDEDEDDFDDADFGGAYDPDLGDDFDDDQDEDDEDDEDDDQDEDEEDDERELAEDEADEVVLVLLQRVEDGEQLDRWEIRDLGLLLGDKKAGASLGRQLNKEAKETQGRRPKRKRGFWHWFAGPIHEQGDPIPNSLASILLRIQEGRPLDAQNFKRLGGVIGRGAVRFFEAVIHGAVDRDTNRGRGRGRGGRR
jgi:hypothetical protein